ncbi:MAG: hypothetical protein SynsKO_24580 [Synoicihabitans sp.]
MKARGSLLAALLLGGCATVQTVPEEETVSAGERSRVVSIEGFDGPLLAAAIFAETNRIRVAHDLPPLRSHAGLSAAANFQSMTNSIAGRLSHDNPFYGRATVVERVRTAGVRARAFWENVAATPLREASEGAAIVYRTNDDGTRTYLDGNTGEPLVWPTYGELARRIMRQWMDSPSHRSNILQSQATFLACGVFMRRPGDGLAAVYSTQVFIAK